MTALTAPSPLLPRFSRNAVIVAGVLAFHVLALWALQSGLLRKAVEVIVPVEILTELIQPPAPKVVPPPPAPPTPVKQPVVKSKVPVRAPAPQPVAIADPTPAPNAPTGVTEPQPPLPPINTPVAAVPAPAPPAPPAPPKVELPSSDADYLQNPPPVYPSMSRKLGEQGKTVIRVLIAVDGTAQKAEINKSSGYDRLDQSALKTVLSWRYTPGKRNGVVEAMWFNVPLNFVLE